MNRERFLAALSHRFPTVFSGISEVEVGLLHPEMAVVSHATRDAIAARSWGEVEAHFLFIEEVFTGGDAEVKNAVLVSYLENVLLGEEGPEFLHARALLPPGLGGAMVELEAHFAKLSRASRGT